MTADQLDALPEGTRIIDRFGGHGRRGTGGAAVTEEFTAVDAIRDVRDALVDAGFEIAYCTGQFLIYRMPNGDRIELRATKKRGR